MSFCSFETARAMGPDALIAAPSNDRLRAARRRAPPLRPSVFAWTFEVISVCCKFELRPLLLFGPVPIPALAI